MQTLLPFPRYFWPCLSVSNNGDGVVLYWSIFFVAVHRFVSIGKGGCLVIVLCRSVIGYSFCQFSIKCV